MVSRSLPPSAGHHRDGKGRGEGNTSNKLDYHEAGGRDEEEMHQAISDSSLSITVVTHGPKLLGRAVSITLYQRTRPVVCLDAFPFAAGNKKHSRWGIVDVIQLGKQKVEKDGEKEGKMENALLLAMICARASVRGKQSKKKTHSDMDVEVVGKDSDESEGSSVDDEGTSEGDSSGDDTDSTSAEGKDVSPASDCYGRILLVRAARSTMEIIKTIDLNGVGSNFIPHVGIHPATYVNKILLGGRPAENHDDKSAAKKSASLLLVNVKSGKMIHSFDCLKSKKSSKKKEGNGQSQGSDDSEPLIITALQQSPAVDTIAVGTSDGSVHLINTLHDVKLFTLHHKSKNLKLSGVNAISSLSFRTDGNATRQGVAPLAVGRDDGSISVWDLTPVEDENGGPTRRTLLTEMEFVHYGGVSNLEYLPGEPLIISTGLVSNSIVMHVFDAPDHSGRILRQRKGHTSPPTLLRYLHPGAGGGGILANASDGTDASSCQILSCGGAGDLSLRVFSSARSNLDKEYSQGAGLEKKAKKLGYLGPEGRAELLLPEIIGLASSEARSRDWGDLVTIHRNHAMAYVWSTKRGSQSGPVLRQPQWNVSAMKQRPPRTANASSLAISVCGNFALVGTVGGVIYKYNLQSGLPRGSFPKDAVIQTEEEERRRKRGLKLAGDVGRSMRMLEKNLMKGGISAGDIDQAERDQANFLEVEAKRKATIDKASHTDAVVGIAIDSLNKTMVTCGADAKLVLWNFVTHMPHKKSPIMLPSPATKLCHVRDSDLAAIAMNDFGVAVFDCSSLAIVRYFGGSQPFITQSPEERVSHTGLISDLGFGPDGRKLFTSSMDGSIRVWDVPTGVCVDWSK
jgi:U3 small nucleolar RNA-associated protein 21